MVPSPLAVANCVVTVSVPDVAPGVPEITWPAANEPVALTYKGEVLYVAQPGEVQP